MKKNITINMFGRLYAIDEDAYRLLQQYIDTLRSYFSRKPDGKEIADDIEARIAELFDDLKANGVEAINIEHVQDIITRIGDPKQMEAGEADEEERPRGEAAAEELKSAALNMRDKVSAYFEQLRRSNKRLYRDPADKKLTGLLAGCAHYFGGDVLWWRLGFVLLFFATLWGGTMMRSIIDGPIRGSFSVWLPVLYFIMAILTPMADKPEDRLMMKGVDVTPHNLAQEVAEEHTHADVIQPQKTGASGCLATVLKATLLLFKAFMVLFGLLVMLVVFTGVAVMVLLLVSPDLFGDDRFARLYRSSVSPEMMVLCLVGLVGLMAISAYCVIHALMSKRQKVEPMSLVQRLVWVVLWMVCLLTACISGVAMVARFSHAEERLDEMEERAYIKANTHDGVFIERDDWDYLSKGGWFLVEPAGGQNRYTDTGEHYSGKGDMRYLNGYADWGLSYQVEHNRTEVPSGTYTLTVTARTDGKGAFVYAVADGKRYMAEILVSGNQGGSVWAEARQLLTGSADSAANIGDRQYYQDIADANDGKGFGWNRVTIEGIKVARGTVSYGVSTRSAFTGTAFGGQWVSATDFRLTHE